MADQFFEQHYQFGIFLRELFKSSNVISLEINIFQSNLMDCWDAFSNPHSIYIYIGLYIQDPIFKTDQIIDWIDNQSHLLSIQHFDDTLMHYSMNTMDFSNFMQYIHTLNPYLNNQQFLNYLKNTINEDIETIGWHRFNSQTLAEDLQSFFTPHVKNYFFSQHLDNTLINKNIDLQTFKTKL
jgi:hypothetical protein